MVTFARGAVGKISATDAVFMPYWFNMQLFGTDGAIQCDNQAFLRSVESDEPTIIPGTIPNSGAVCHHPFEGMIAELINSIRNGVETSCNIFHAENTHAVCFAAEKSARSGGTPIRLHSTLMP